MTANMCHSRIMVVFREDINLPITRIPIYHADGLADRNPQRQARGRYPMAISFDDIRTRLLADPVVQAQYDALAPEFEISSELVRARMRAGLSRAELATRMGTSRSAIARLESGQTLPSTKTLLRFTRATESRPRIRLPAA
jgi:DNA-binding XRE family transcriptional regulator